LTATTEEPAVTLRLWADGTGEVIVEGVAAPISAGALRAARAQGLAQVQQLAARSGEPVRFVSYDPEGRWQLVMAPDGQVSEDDGSTATPDTAVEEAAAPGKEPEREAESAQGSQFAVPATRRRAERVPAKPTPAPSAKQRPYDSEYVMGSIVPVTRVPKSTRGWRGMLGIGPGAKERAERADRDAACQAYGRPVTIVVADPRGGSGKTTTSLLLAGAFGTARGGGVLALENHELRGTMHLRTGAPVGATNIRDLISAQQDNQGVGEAMVRLGDLSGFVRHQVAGQYDVLVSATKSGRSLKREEFEDVHALVSRFYQMIIVDTANNESAENWRAAIDKADALVVPVKWRNDYSVPAIEMLEELENSGDERVVGLVRRAVVVASHGQGDVDSRCRQHLMPYFADRTRAVIEIDPDPHIAEGNVIQHDQLSAATRRKAERVAAEVAHSIRAGMAAPS
jgi:MinD-like ATPase involved in chromosome partitioning or flagellar assembly